MVTLSNFALSVFLVAFYTSCLFGQSELAINRLLIPAIDEGWIELLEAKSISTHILHYGWPVVPEEAWSIPNLRAEVAKRLAVDPRWRLWCEWGKDSALTYKKKGESVTWSVIGVGDYGGLSNNYEGSEVGVLSRFRGANWGLVLEKDVGELGIDFAGGYYKGGRSDGWNWIIGDHRLQWGSGVTVSRYDPFQSIRDTHSLGQTSRAFDGVNSGDGSPSRRGVAIKYNSDKWWYSASINFQNKEYRWDINSGLSWYNSGLHRTETERNRIRAPVSSLAWGAFQKKRYFSIGIVGELGRAWIPDSLAKTHFSTVIGGVARLEKNALSCESEITIFNGGLAFHNRMVLSISRNSYIFSSLDRDNKNHSGVNWGAKIPSETTWLGSIGYSLGSKEMRLVVKSRVKNGTASFRAIGTLESDLTEGMSLQTRAQIIGSKDNGTQFNVRLRWDIGIIRFSGEWLKSDLVEEPYDLRGSRAFRVDIRGDKPLTVAVMNGIDGMEGRMYQLLPTARGYRLFSVGDATSRALLKWEMIPDRLTISFEKVWPSDINKSSSQRISILLEGR